MCIAPVSITIGTKKQFYWRISAFGIPIPKVLFSGKDKKGDSKKKERKKSRSLKKKGKAESNKKQECDKEKENSGEKLELALELVKQLLSDFPKSVRIKLCFLDITVGGKEAADVALNYGRFYALIEGVLALLHSYKGVLYGFFADRAKIILNTDYTSEKTKVKFKIRISFFVWQLLYVAFRTGIKHIIFTLKQGKDKK